MTNPETHAQRLELLADHLQGKSRASIRGGATLRSAAAFIRSQAARIEDLESNVTSPQPGKLLPGESLEDRLRYIEESRNLGKRP